MSYENFSKNLEVENKKNLIKQINSLLSDYSNKIPDTIIHGDAENINFKVRTNWFTGVVNTLENSEELLPENLKLELYDFIESFKNRRNGNDDTKTTKEEIDIVDNLLKKVKEYIEKSM